MSRPELLHRTTLSLRLTEGTGERSTTCRGALLIDLEASRPDRPGRPLGRAQEP